MFSLDLLTRSVPCIVLRKIIVWFLYPRQYVEWQGINNLNKSIMVLGRKSEGNRGKRAMKALSRIGPLPIQVAAKASCGIWCAHLFQGLLLYNPRNIWGLYGTMTWNILELEMWTWWHKFTFFSPIKIGAVYLSLDNFSVIAVSCHLRKLRQDEKW